MNKQRFIRFSALATALLVVQGCTTMTKEPEFLRSGISPDQLQPGDLAIITVDVQDKHNIVARIEGVVQEDPRITFDLNDQGVNSDEKAGDGTWSFGVKVPFQAPSGEFILDLVAFRSDGVPVSIRDDDGNVVPLKSTVPLRIGGAGTTMNADEAPTGDDAPEPMPAE